MCSLGSEPAHRPGGKAILDGLGCGSLASAVGTQSKLACGLAQRLREQGKYGYLCSLTSGAKGSGGNRLNRVPAQQGTGRLTADSPSSPLCVPGHADLRPGWESTRAQIKVGIFVHAFPSHGMCCAMGSGEGVATVPTPLCDHWRLVTSCRAGVLRGPEGEAFCAASHPVVAAAWQAGRVRRETVLANRASRLPLPDERCGDLCLFSGQRQRTGYVQRPRVHAQ